MPLYALGLTPQTDERQLERHQAPSEGAWVFLSPSEKETIHDEGRFHTMDLHLCSNTEQ